DRAFIEPAARDDRHVSKARFVEPLPGAARERGDVARIEADGAKSAIPALRLGHGDRVVDTREGIVGVDEKSRVGKDLQEAFEGRSLGGASLDEAVRHRAFERQTVGETACDIRGRGDAGDEESAPAADGRVDSLRAPCAKIADRTSLRRRDDARRLGGENRLRSNSVEDQGLDELRLRERRGDFENGLLVEEGRSLAHRDDVAAKAKAAQPVKKGLGKLALRTQLYDFFIAEAKLFDVVEKLAQAASEKIIADLRQLSHEKAEGRRLRQIELKIG